MDSDSKINWHNFDGPKFQRLCNSLLIAEISPHVEVFDKEGKDGGVDAKFVGAYGLFNGNWRIQAKFHAPTAGGGSAAFWQDIKKDLNQHLAAEDFILYITNVHLLPQKSDELKTRASAMISAKFRNAKVLIWDGGQIQALLMQHPVLMNGFWPDRTAILQPYSAYFSSQLSGNRTAPFSFQNESFGREDTLKKLSKFLDHKEDWLCSIVAPGGYGKTRLCFDLFQLLSRENSDWTAYVLLKGEFDLSNLNYCLMGKGKYLILIDDAHLEKRLSTILQVVGNDKFKGKVKVILTTRNSLLDGIKEALSSNQSLGMEISLAPLPTSEALKMILPVAKAYIEKRLATERIIDNYLHPEELARQIESQAKGVPLMIMTFVNALSRHHNPKAIFTASDLNFVDIVWKYIREEIANAKQNLGIKEKKINLALRIMALTSPFGEADFERIFQQVGMSEGDFKRLAKLLMHGGFLRKDNPFDHLVDELGQEGLKKIRIKYDDHNEYSIVPDPYKDLIVASCFADTTFYGELILSPFGTHFANQLFNNIFVALDVIPDSKEDGQKVFDHFPKRIGLAASSLEIIRKSLQDANWAARTNRGIAIEAFNQVLDLVENRSKDWRSRRQEKDGERLQGEILNLAEEIFKTHVMGVMIDEDSYVLLIRYCKAIGNWRLLASCSESNFVPFKGISYHNIDFLIQKVKGHFIEMRLNPSLGLQYIGWVLGLSDFQNAKGSWTSSGYRYFDIWREDSPIPSVRMNLLKYLWSHRHLEPSSESMILQMFLGLLQHFSIYFIREGNDDLSELDINQARRNQTLATTEMVFAYDCIHELIRPRHRDFQFKYEFWFNLRVISWHRAFPQFSPLYESLVQFAESADHIGETIALVKLWESWSDQEVSLHKVIALVGSITTAQDAVNQLIAYYQVIDAIEVKTLPYPWLKTTYPYLVYAEHGGFDLKLFFDILLQEYPELLWRGRGDILFTIGFGPKSDREFFSERVNQLLALRHQKAYSEILDAYMCLKPLEAYEFLSQRDFSVMETICSQLEAWYASPTGNGNCVNTSDLFLEVLTCFVRLDHLWTHRICSRILPLISETQQQNLLYALWKQEDHNPGAVPFLRDLLFEFGVTWNDAPVHYPLNKVILLEINKTRFDQVFDFFRKYLQNRFQRNTPPQLIYRPLLPIDVFDPGARDLRWHGETQVIAFETILQWYLGLDFEIDPYFMDDAWHVLKFFRPERWEGYHPKALLSRVFANFSPSPRHQLHCHTALFLYIKELDMVNDLIRENSMPQPSPSELEDLNVGYDDSERTAPMRFLANYWIDHCPYKSERIVNFLKDLMRENYLWK